MDKKQLDKKTVDELRKSLSLLFEGDLKWLEENYHKNFSEPTMVKDIDIYQEGYNQCMKTIMTELRLVLRHWDSYVNGMELN